MKKLRYADLLMIQVVFTFFAILFWPVGLIGVGKTVALAMFYFVSSVFGWLITVEHVNLRDPIRRDL